MKRKLLAVMLLVIMALVVGCQAPADNGGEDVAEAETLVLATTTSTYDSGLLDYLLPEFEEEHNLEVDIISVGTGQAIATGKSGDCDIILVHARQLEDEFVAEGFGTQRWDVMYNDFVYLGPADDPAEIAASESLTEALEKMIADMEENDRSFVSRGDESGTHVKELNLWALVDCEPGGEDWYMSIGQGMGDTLITTNEMGGYALTDRGTYLAMQDNLPNLKIVFDGDNDLFNPYGIIPVNPELHSHVKYDEAMLLVEFFISPETQEKISKYGEDEFGQALFFPNAQ